MLCKSIQAQIRAQTKTKTNQQECSTIVQMRKKNQRTAIENEQIEIITK